MQTVRRRILIVEDDPAILDGLCRLLGQAGYEPIVAEKGADALERIQVDPPALMLLDLVLPDVDGYEVCRRVRNHAGYVPIVMLTARGELADKLVGLEVGADAYIAKPFEPRELLAQIRALLRLIDQRQTDSQQASPLECGHVRLWEQQHRVEVDGDERELTPKEFELLRHFLRHPGQVFGRETLLREIWGYDFLGDSRTVDVHIQRLRGRIERDPAAPRLIRTVRGFGYQLVAVDARTTHGHRS